MAQKRFTVGLLTSLLGFGIIAATVNGALPPKNTPAKNASSADTRESTDALISQVEAATLAAKSMSADFTYSVSSVKSQQFITGSVRMMKPNFARVNFTYMAKPAFPNLVASDGKVVYSFTPSSFRPDRRFNDGPWNPLTGAQQASGLMPGGGKIGTDPADQTGANIHLWDAVPIQAFFGPRNALQNYIFADPSTLKYEGVQTINDARYRVLQHHFSGGDIAGGEASDFEQHVYIGADNLIHGYVLEFRSGGRPGIQIAWLKNVRINEPMTEKDFAFSH